jgi:hypothetical protein
MRWIMKVNSVRAFLVPMPLPTLPDLFIASSGEVSTSGWSGERLSPRFYISPPPDGIWDFDFFADPPAGVALDVVVPVHASRFTHSADWVRGIRVHAGQDGSQHVETKLDTNAKFATVQRLSVLESALGANIYQRDIAHFEDSWQPIGMCSLISVKMKKLKHTLTLTIEGPDRQHMEKCAQQAFAVGIMAAIAAAFATGGLGLKAAIEAAVGYLVGCLGSGYNVRFDDRSHWEEWCT